MMTWSSLHESVAVQHQLSQTIHMACKMMRRAGLRRHAVMSRSLARGWSHNVSRLLLFAIARQSLSRVPGVWLEQRRVVPKLAFGKRNVARAGIWCGVTSRAEVGSCMNRDTVVHPARQSRSQSVSSPRPSTRPVQPEKLTMMRRHSG